MVATSEMLSAMVRDFGCVAIWSRMAESGGDDVLRRDRDIESVGGAVMRAARVGSGFAAESGIVPSARPVESRVESRRVEALGAGAPAPQAATPIKSKAAESVVSKVIEWRPCNGRTGNSARYI